MKEFSTEAKVGQLILVHGPTGSGKNSLIKLIDDRFAPLTGQVLYSPHLTTLLVGCVPMIFHFESLLDNLKVGTHKELADMDRIRKIFSRIGIPKDHWLMARLNKDIAAWIVAENAKAESTDVQPTVSVDDDDSLSMDDQEWGANICGSELRKISIARALIHNPEIMILDRPMDETDEKDCLVLMELLREHVSNKCLELNDDEKYPFVYDYSWAPRTVFVTIGENAQCKLLEPFADTLWGNRTVLEPGESQKKQVWEEVPKSN